jgi:AhpD family alkylhydroperoxidase
LRKENQAMTNDVQDFFRDIAKTKQKMAKQIPEPFKAFYGLHEKVMEAGALDKKQKELIALGIAVASHCKPCIYQHTQAAVQEGATPKEILEAAGVAVLMAGGPAFAHLPEIMKVFDVLGVKY